MIAAHMFWSEVPPEAISVANMSGLNLNKCKNIFHTYL